MSTAVVQVPISRAWKDLYQAAIFEINKDKQAERIAVAEAALGSRARELFNAGLNPNAERQAVDAAMSSLQALRSASAAGKEKVRKKGVMCSRQDAARLSSTA